MPIVSIYNNKGGVGKSTLTVGIAEFLATNRKRDVLVIDLDAQASSSGSLLGRSAVTASVAARRSITHLVGEMLRSRKAPPKLDSFITSRPASAARGTALESLAVLVPDKPGMIDLEERMTPQDLFLLRDGLKPSFKKEKFVLIDLPGNIDRRSRLAVAALLMSDFVLIPVEPSQISLNALPDTFSLIHHVHDLGRNVRPAIIGLVLNKTDKRTEQYRSRFAPILEAAGRGELPPVFDNIVPDTPTLATATDETHEFSTLKNRFDTYYDHVRKVTLELEKRCNEYKFPTENGGAEGYAKWLHELLGLLGSRRNARSTTRRGTVA